jgi:hypothetical protein
MQHRKITTPLLFSILLSIIGCNNKNQTDPGLSEQRLEESGDCSPRLLDELNTSELYTQTYLSYGMKYGGYLLSAQKIYGRITTDYIAINCQAKDSATGKIQVITKNYIQRLSTENDKNIQSAITICQNSSYQTGSAEDLACKQLQQ